MCKRLLFLVVLLQLPAQVSVAFANTQVDKYSEPSNRMGFNLIGKGHSKITANDFRGYWNVVLLGYMSCPDICPATLRTLNSAIDKLVNNGVHIADLRVWFVSVDPERDNIENLSKYVGFFDNRINAVTGEHSELTKLARSLRLRYKIQPHRRGEVNYLVDHSSQIAVIGPNLELKAILDNSVPSKIARSLGKLLVTD